MSRRGDSLDRGALAKRATRGDVVGVPDHRKRTARRSVAAVACAFAIVASLHAAPYQRVPRSAHWRLSANHASASEWAMLPGIGPSRARAIVDDRRQHGPLRSVDDLQRVKGIGPATVDSLRPWLVVVETP